jgi:phage shock protein A
MQTPEQQIAELEQELAEADTRIAELETEVGNLEAELEDATGEAFDEDYYVEAEVLSEVRRLIHRGQFGEAIELADRHLPGKLRYAA